MNLIINPDNNGYSKGVIFFDNDENDIIEYENYYRIYLEFKNEILKIKGNNINSINYKYKDNILNKIEIWRISELYKNEDIVNGKFNLIIKLKNNKTKKKVKGILSEINDKVIFNLENISLFELSEIVLKKMA